jgi:hypothetical protein
MLTKNSPQTHHQPKIKVKNKSQSQNHTRVKEQQRCGLNNAVVKEQQRARVKPVKIKTISGTGTAVGAS